LNDSAFNLLFDYFTEGPHPVHIFENPAKSFYLNT